MATVYCDNCETPLYKTGVLPTVGSPPRIEFFAALPGIPTPKPGEPFRCPVCNAHLLVREPDTVWTA